MRSRLKSLGLFRLLGLFAAGGFGLLSALLFAYGLCLRPLDWRDLLENLIVVVAAIIFCVRTLGCWQSPQRGQPSRADSASQGQD